MSEVVYHVVEHDGGWAYQFDGVYSETFATRAQAEAAATQAAAEQRVPGDTEQIEWQDGAGTWHEEREPGNDRPETSVEGARGAAHAVGKSKAGGGSTTALMLLAGVVGLLLAITIRGRASV